MNAVVFGLDDKVSRSGDAMTGPLTVPALTVTGAMNENPSFQSGISPWTLAASPGPLGGGASLTQSSSFAYPGTTYSARMVPDGTNAIIYANSEQVACSGDTEYTAMTWVYCPTGYAPSGSGNGFTVALNWYDSGNEYISTSSAYVSLATAAWQFFLTTYTSPANAASYVIVPALNDTPPSSAIVYLYYTAAAQASYQQLTAVIAAAFQLPATGKSGYVLTADAYGNGSWQPASGGPSLPLSIGNGGTGQSSAAAAFNALSPLTTLGDMIYASGSSTAARLAGSTSNAKRFLTQTGTGSASAAPAWNGIASGDLPGATTSAQGAVVLDGTAGDVAAVPGAQSAGSIGKAADAGHVHPANIVVDTSAVTVSGTTTLTKLADGITIPNGGLAAGQLYRFTVWGKVTTTVDTQTVKLGLYLGGVAGTDLLDFSGQPPNSSATVTNAAFSVTFEMIVLTSTTVTVWGWDALDFFMSAENQTGSVTVSNSSAQELVIGVTPSATAVSITASGGYCQRLA